jgi:hypothetical protein
MNYEDSAKAESWRPLTAVSVVSGSNTVGIMPTFSERKCILQITCCMRWCTRCTRILWHRKRWEIAESLITYEYATQHVAPNLFILLLSTHLIRVDVHTRKVSTFAYEVIMKLDRNVKSRCLLIFTVVQAFVIAWKNTWSYAGIHQNLKAKI